MKPIQPFNRRLADQVAVRVAAVIGTPLFTLAATAAIVEANVAGTALADVALAAYLAGRYGRAVPALGLYPDAVAIDAQRIAANLTRIAADEAADASPDETTESRRDRLTAYARSEPLLTVASTIQRGLVARELWWVRSTSADPCELCQAWADGVPRPPGVTMARHRNCGCTPSPVAAPS